MFTAPPETLLNEVTDFLVSRPTPEAIIAFQASEPLDRRLHDLLDKNGEGHLSDEERAELERFLQINHLLIVLKTKARLKLAESK